MCGKVHIFKGPAHTTDIFLLSAPHTDHFPCYATVEFLGDFLFATLKKCFSDVVGKKEKSAQKTPEWKASEL